MYPRRILIMLHMIVISKRDAYWRNVALIIWSFTWIHYHKLQVNDTDNEKVESSKTVIGNNYIKDENDMKVKANIKHKFDESMRKDEDELNKCDVENKKCRSIVCYINEWRRRRRRNVRKTYSYV